MPKITIIILSLLLVSGGGIFFFFFSGNKSTHIQQDLSSETKTSDTYAQSLENQQKSESEDISQYNLAVEKLDIGMCSTLVSPSRKQECQDMIYASLAQSADNIEQCQKLSQSGMVLQCQDNVYIARAQKEGKKSLCDSVGAKNLKEHCQKQVDRKSLQDAIEKNTLSKQFCESLISDLVSECMDSFEQKDDANLYNQAIESKDLKKCSQLGDNSLQNLCHDTIVFQMALSEENIDYCNSLTDVMKKKYCQTTISKKSDALRFQEIVATGDISECNKLIDKKFQYQCSDMITIAQVRATHDKDLCGNLFNTGMQYACVQIADANK